MLLARHILLAACLVIFLSGCAPFSGNPVASELKGRRAAVFVFLSPDCPLSQNYVPTLNELRTKFQAKGMEFFGVFAGRAAESAAGFARTYEIKFPVLHDADFRLADFLQATTTPESFILDGAGRIMYSGAIDNRAPELGQRRTVITEHYVLDALQSIVDQRKVQREHIRPVGCFIERKR